MKTTGSFESLIRGVSEQVPHARLPGQHWAQENMLSDPVRGLVRRWGSRMHDERKAPGAADMLPATLEDVGAYAEQSLYLGAIEYSISHRIKPKPAGSTAGGLLCVNKDTRKFLDVQVDPLDTVLTEVLDGGLAAVTSVGRFILGAAASKATDNTVTDTVALTNNYSVCWVRSGQYSRTYTIGVRDKATQTRYVAQYTTPSSYYPGTLNTSDISYYKPDGTTPDPEYQKKINDRVYEYQTAVNQWIGTASAAIMPAAIAEQLKTALTTAGFPGTIDRIDSTLCFDSVDSTTMSDGGDNSTVASVDAEVEAINDLSTKHFVGKVVKVQPKANSSAGAYYVKARAKVSGETGFTDVIWEETAGELVTPGFMMMIGTVEGGILYLASNPTDLAALSGVDVPIWEPSVSGDLATQPLPGVLGRKITYCRVFQDRLMLCAGSTVFMSKSGDYFNLFRASALQILDDDPIEIYALGAEDDIITSGAMLDRNLILFGGVWQYAITGRDKLVPSTAYMAIQSAYSDANGCSPVAAGNLIFYTQPRDTRLTAQQMQTGAYADTLDSFEISQQLSTYLSGMPQQIVSVTSPSAVFIRTSKLQHGFYVYSYLDAPGQTERLFDSWSRWSWHESLGDIVSMSGKDGSLLTITYRNGNDGPYYVLDEFSLAATLSPYPYIDSWRPYSEASTVGSASNIEFCSVALTADAGQYAYIGRPLEDADELIEQFPDQVTNMVKGFNFDSSVSLTNPYIRDQDGKAILDSTLTLGSLFVTLVDSAAMKAWLLDTKSISGVPTEVLNWVARPAGSWILNTQQVLETASVSVGVFKEVRDCRVTLASRSWLPFGLSAIEWQGQYFTRRK